MFKWIRRHALYFAWITSLSALVLSLYFSEIMHLYPCNLCWYQRILMYPLVIFIAIGIIKKDKGLKHYILPFSIAGLFVALYHYLLQSGIIRESIKTCSAAAPCDIKQIVWFNFLTIPSLSFIAFTIITISLIIHEHEE